MADRIMPPAEAALERFQGELIHTGGDGRQFWWQGYPGRAFETIEACRADIIKFKRRQRPHPATEVD